ncbi:MAG: acetate kinase, partial [Gammaproteobacteria bacterium]
MGTRCGSLDPGVILYLLQEKQMQVKDIEHLLYTQSGLLGVSDISNDMRDLLSSDQQTAREAIELYIYRFIRESGSLINCMHGLDGLVFTGGIGEHAVQIREQICNKLAWLGIELDIVANSENCAVISKASSSVKVCVIPANEELMIAKHTYNTLTA